ncbi:MAG: DUF58 domain-containing protein [Terriglobia bacterium]
MSADSRFSVPDSGFVSGSSRFAVLVSRFPWLKRVDLPGWKSFGVALLLLSGALLLALHGAAAFEAGHKRLGAFYATAALVIAAYVAFAIVPVLARRTPLRWLVYELDYKFTREGVVYLVAIFVIILAALNTGNNLLFIILSSLLAGILISGIVSRMVLTGIRLDFLLPDHIFAQQPVRATVKLTNEKVTLPSFSLYVAGDGQAAAARRGLAARKPPGVLTETVYFPYIPRGKSAVQPVELLFARRGRYAQSGFRVSSKFPFGFLLKTRTLPAATDIVVYPPVHPTEEFYEILPLISGEMESFYRGRGHDLYAIRDYQPTDTARSVDWKASAKTQQLKVREFTREDERRVELVFDPFLPSDARRASTPPEPAEDWLERFERGVTLCACLAWHFYEIASQMKFRTAHYQTRMAPASEIIYDVLYHLAYVEPQPADDAALLPQLAADPNTFKIVLTARPRGSIPTSLWTSAYIVFMHAL